ncbi:MAG: hypothetical protein AVDCRST_MAG18-552, partial [uncultured Thermomicrobiales bacterium]
VCIGIHRPLPQRAAPRQRHPNRRGSCRQPVLLPLSPGPLPPDPAARGRAPRPDVAAPGLGSGPRGRALSARRPPQPDDRRARHPPPPASARRDDRSPL